MHIYQPCIITPRLMAGVKIGDDFVSIERSGVTPDGRDRFSYYIDRKNGGEYSASDLKSGVGGCSLQQALGNLLCFMGACAGAVDYNKRFPGSYPENMDLFPVFLHEWLTEHEDEISMLQSEIEAGDTAIEE